MKNYIIADGCDLYDLQKSVVESNRPKMDFNHLFEMIVTEHGHVEKSNALFLYRGIGNDSSFTEKLSTCWTCLAMETRDFYTTERWEDSNPTATLCMLLGILIQQKEPKTITLVSSDPAILAVINLAKTISSHKFRVVWPTVLCDEFTYMSKVRNIEVYQNIYRTKKHDKEKEVRQTNAIKAFLE